MEEEIGDDSESKWLKKQGSLFKDQFCGYFKEIFFVCASNDLGFLIFCKGKEKILKTKILNSLTTFKGHIINDKLQRLKEVLVLGNDIVIQNELNELYAEDPWYITTLKLIPIVNIPTILITDSKKKKSEYQKKFDIIIYKEGKIKKTIPKTDIFPEIKEGAVVELLRKTDDDKYWSAKYSGFTFEIPINKIEPIPYVPSQSPILKTELPEVQQISHIYQESVESYLNQNGLSELIPVFLEQEFGIEEFLALKKEKLQKLVNNEQHQKKLIALLEKHQNTVEYFLYENGLVELIPFFAKEEFSLEDFLLLDEEKLKKKVNNEENYRKLVDVLKKKIK